MPLLLLFLTFSWLHIALSTFPVSMPPLQDHQVCLGMNSLSILLKTFRLFSFCVYTYELSKGKKIECLCTPNFK